MLRKDLAINVLGIAGLALFAWGIYFVSPAISLVVVGAILFVGAVVGAWVER